MTQRLIVTVAGTLFLLSYFSMDAGMATADVVPIVNSGFEDTTGQSVFNELTFGEPVGWATYDPMNIVPSPGVFTGTLMPNGTDFFNTTAPEGARVSILFNSSREGDGAYGYEQTLAEVFTANTAYELTVAVGNIASGTGTSGTFFNLDEFPGYQVDLLAGGNIVASDLNSLTIAEGEFATSTVTFTTGTSDAFLGQALGIRLVNLNLIPDGFNQATSPDLEVDFDNVILTATSVPEPGAVLFLVGGLVFATSRRRKR